MSNVNILIKSTVVTILYVVILEIVAFWVIIPKKIGVDINNIFFFINGFLHLIIVFIFVTLIFKGESQVWKSSSMKWYIIAVFFSVFFIFLQYLLDWFYDKLMETSYYNNYSFKGTKIIYDVNLLSTIIFIPIAEELFFRRYIQEKLQNSLNSVLAIFISSFLFALVHSPYQNLIWSEFNYNWHLSYITFFGGLISSFLYFKSRSVGPSVTFHVFWNFILSIL